jgi:hypothetical protein
MGDIKVADKIIVTEVLSLNLREWKDLVGEVATVIHIEKYVKSFPYKVEIRGWNYWVEGVPHSSLMEELF